MTIRPASLADLDQVTALLAAQFDEHRIDTPPTDVARALDGLLRRPERARVLVATDGDRIVGIAALSFAWPLEHARRAAWLEELYVDPSRRGDGVGTALLRAACDAVAESGGVAVDLEVDVAHRRAADLYKREGFEPLERERWVRRLAPVPSKPSDGPALPITGGCFCGAIRYRASARPIEVSYCHCSICRRTSGAPMVAWATFARDELAFVAGVPAELRSSAKAVRSFCATCGTALTFRENARPRLVDVTVCSLERPEAVAPTEHIWTASQLPWLNVEDDLPRFPGEAG
jgi:ribosomal protein S18 acetylase RimI-like enzyme